MNITKKKRQHLKAQLHGVHVVPYLLPLETLVTQDKNKTVSKKWKKIRKNVNFQKKQRMQMRK